MSAPRAPRLMDGMPSLSALARAELTAAGRRGTRTGGPWQARQAIVSHGDEWSAIAAITRTSEVPSWYGWRAYAMSATARELARGEG